MAFVLPGSNSSLVRPYEHISKLDPAVDRPADCPEHNEGPAKECADCKAVEEFEARWSRYLDGAEPAPLKPNGDPTRFWMRHINAARERSAIVEVHVKQSRLSAWVLAASIALTRVENLFDEDGKEVKVERVKDGTIDRVADKVMDAIPPDVVMEIGERAYSRMTLSPLS